MKKIKPFLELQLMISSFTAVKRGVVNFIFVLMIFTVPVLGAEIHDAVQKGEVVKIKAILEKDPLAVNLEDERSWTPLHWAALRGNKEVVELLITRGAVVKVSDRSDRTPLHYASYHGHQEVVKLLIQKGAIVDAKAIGSASPLNWAAQAGQTGVGKILIENGADVHAKCNAEVTPLYFAALRGKKDFLELLLSYGAAVNFSDYTGKTPLQAAVIRGHLEITGILLEKGADKNIKEKHTGRTLLHLAAIYGYTPVVRRLLAAGLDPNSKDNKNMTPLDYAARHNHPEITAVLESKGTGKTGKKIEPTTTFFDKKLKQGEAVLWRLRGRSWAVKTKTRFIIFNYSVSGNIPVNPSLASGYLSARQLKGQQLVAFEAYPANNPEVMTVCKLEDNTTKINTHYVLNAAYKEQYQKQNVTCASYMKPGEMKKLKGMEIAVTPSEGANRGYYISVDNIGILWTPDKVNHYSQVDTFKEDVAFLAKKAGKIDIIILGTPVGLGPENDRALEGILEYLEPLQAKAIIPRGDNHLCRMLVKEAAAKRLKTKVYHVDNPGDVLFHKNDTIVIQ